ncbi:MAG: ComF family protein [Tannerella sp.]|jgi:ComF family protein|nr:ComF family protein [Tannerella sp.]
MIQTLRKLWNEATQLFYPEYCILCGRLLIADERQICLHCLFDLPRTHYHGRTDRPMESLFSGFPQVKDVFSFLFFEREGTAQTLIHSFKYRNNKYLAEALGEIAGTEMRADGLFCDVDCLIPVPLHPKKKRMRGYNQSEWIAKGIANVYQIPVYEKAVTRRVYTMSQTRKTTYDRRLNVEKIFAVNDMQILAGQHVLLIDDVITSGATTTSCIEALTVVPDIRISVFSLAFAGS